MPKEPKIKILKARIPKTCVCPNCGVKQLFKSGDVYWKIVKDINLDEPVLLKVQIVRAKCLNPNCDSS
ncbi:MAG: hypothetical protein QMD71_06865 [bacterium]|nr:hypothetical protein [bacterium]